MVEQAAVQAELAAIVGAEHVVAAADTDALDGVQPRLVVAPGDGAELAAVLRYANASGLRVAPRGGGTKLGWGNPPTALDLILSTRRLARVLEHAAGDMTATVQAGCPVARLQQVLAEQGQHLALDPLWPSAATIGGVLATNDSGALRLRFGAPRDLLLGVTVALPNGTLARSGGKVVKNVAGYDLPKLMIGALGTLGVIVEATVRLYPLPAAAVTLSAVAADVTALNALTLKVLDSTLAPTSMQIAAASHTTPRADIRFEGIPAALDAQTEQLQQIAAQVAGVRGTGESEPTVWQQRETLWQSADNALICKVSVLPAQLSALAALLQRVATPLRSSWTLIMQAVGVGRLRLEGANEQVLLTALTLLRAEIAALGGSLVVQHCPAALKGRIDVWGAAGDALPLLRAVKARFDPRATLNPGRLWGF